MASFDPKLAHFSLRGRKIEELRSLADQFLGKSGPEVIEMTKLDLIGELSEEAAENRQLSKELRKGAISVKPSFYLLRFSDDAKIPLGSARQQLSRYLQQHSSGLKNLQLQLVDEPDTGLVQVFLTWQSLYNYWAPSFAMERVERLELGFAFLDYRVRKAIVVCHSVKERDEITKLLAKGFSTSFSSLVLTKPLLEQIGTFESVKRAQYAIAKADAATPENITYADENLAARSLARDEEDNPRSQRRQSFYRIPITSPLLEEGVGATSDSGKLWIPKEIPFDSIREYSTTLLGKISGTLDRMTRSDEIEAVLSTFPFDDMPDLVSADPLAFRDSLANLLRVLIIMLSRREEERPYAVPFEIVRYGAPRFFLHPRLRLVDPDTGDVGFWSSGPYQSQQVVLSGDVNNMVVKSFPGNAIIDLSALSHPVTSAVVEVENVLEALELVPNELFLKIIRSTVSRVCGQIPKLKGITNVIFRISGGLIALDIRRAYGDPNVHPTMISAAEIGELQPILQKQSISPKKRPTVQAKLVDLGEKCVHMTDENCKTCVKDRDKLCLRSLVGRYFKQTEILAHKGIELCDLTCKGTVGSKQRRMWGFAKLPSGKGDKGLTVRNKPGAILLAQILGQIDKTTYQTVLVICPSPVNTDFQERAEVLCSAFGKQLCFLDGDDLGRLLLDFEEQAPFDGLDVDDIYRNSRTKKSRPKEKGRSHLARRALSPPSRKQLAD
jgi:hypothetical protein